VGANGRALIRATAIGLIVQNAKHLLVEIRDRKTGKRIYRPPGGGIQIGELAHEALHRELCEELRCSVRVGNRLGVFEELYELHGERRHEIVFVFEAEFANRESYHRRRFEFRESSGRWFAARWMDLSEREVQRAIRPLGLVAVVAGGSHVRQREAST